MMEAEFHSTGGTYLGGAYASWPFAKLTASREQLRISVPTFAPLAESQYMFPAESVISVKRLILLPVLAWGIRIEHTVATYPRRIIFWSLASPSRLIAGLASVGFEARSNQAFNATARKRAAR
jgi:hypothetical protein